MAEVGGLGLQIINIYKEFLSYFPPNVGLFFNFLILTLLIIIYLIIVWEIYRFISKKNPLGLNLIEHTRYEKDFLYKLFTAGLYFLEYIIIFPFILFAIFLVFALFVIIFLKDVGSISQILIISAVIIAAIRMTAYYKHELSQEIAKILPIALLEVPIVNPGTYTEAIYLEKVISQISQLPQYAGKMLYYLGFIIILEATLLFFDYLFSLFGLVENHEEEES